MSFDVYLTIKTGKNSSLSTNGLNVTYNLSPMFHEALGMGLSDLEGKTGKECIPILKKALKDMIDNPEKYEAMNPSNGWGDFYGAKEFISSLLDDCRKYEFAKIVVS